MSKTPDSIALKIKRADKHIDELQGIIRAFQDGRPYEVQPERDPKTREWILRIAKAAPLDENVPAIIGDVIQNLYSALDYLAWQMVVAAKIKAPSGNTAFPITEVIPTTKDQVARYDRQVDGMRDEAKKIIKAMKPYRRENNHFWRLHKLNNLNKHRDLLTIAFASGGTAGPVDFMRTAEFNYGPLEKGSILARTSATTIDHRNIQLFLDVAFSEPEADCVALPVLLTLRECRNLVWRTVQTLAAYR
jgi:hypothetical protein